MTEFERTLGAAIDRGMHVTTRNIGGMTDATIHDPTDEARQAAIDAYDAFFGKLKEGRSDAP